MVGLYLHECSKLFVGRIRTQGICGSQKKATTELTAQLVKSIGCIDHMAIYLLYSGLLITQQTPNYCTF